MSVMFVLNNRGMPSNVSFNIKDTPNNVSLLLNIVLIVFSINHG